MRVFARPSGLRVALRVIGGIWVAAAISTSAIAVEQQPADAVDPAITVEQPTWTGTEEQPAAGSAEEQPVTASGADEPVAAGGEEQLASADPTAMAPVSPAGGPAPRLVTYLDPPLERIPTEGKAIFVNIPSYELIAFEDGREVLRSRVIVGSPKNPTPEMTTETSVVSFRPTWTPTPEMIRDEGISPETRPPGKDNPLGLLAIRFEAGNLIYLHDTNNRKLFSRDKRALSHGCIRVEKWDELAAFVLGIPVEEVRKHAEGRRSFDMKTEGVPVVVRYKTKFPDEFGVMREYADVYGRDARYAKALKSKPEKTSTNWDALPSSWSF